MCGVIAPADIFLVASNSCDLRLDIKKLHLVALVTLDGRYREVPEAILLKHCPSSTLLQGPGCRNALQTVMLA